MTPDQERAWLNDLIDALIERWLDVRIARKYRTYAYKEIRDKLGDRDGWACGICGQPIPVYAYPDPESASVDHIVPKALGGPDTATNLQITHLRCNQAKGKRTTAACPA